MFVERSTHNERAWAVAAAAAHDWNDELTVILNSISSLIKTLGKEHPAIPILLDLQGAAQRCAWKSSGLLNCTARHGTRAGSAPMETIIRLVA